MKNNLALVCVLLCFITPIFGQNELKIELKDDPNPEVYIDGVKYDHKIFELLDQNKIESVNVIKGEQAIQDYNAPNGVIIIKTKEAKSVKIERDGEIVIKNKKEDKNPVFIIDGKSSKQEVLEKMSPDDIESIEVVKGQKAIDEYNAPNGVIIIKTKKN